MTTNRSITSSLLRAIASVAAAGKIAQLVESPTMLQWLGSGMRGATMGASTFTGLETGVVAAGTGLMNAALVGSVFEIGVGGGSAINVLIMDCEEEDPCMK